MTRTLEVLFTPADFGALQQRDLSATTCVVFDILRATTTMLTALANGATAVIPVSEIAAAIAIRQRQSDVLLAGERDGVRIVAAQTGGVDFDLGNSPREFTPEHVRGRTIVTTTTNGTRALRAVAPAKTVLIGAFLNLRALATWIQQQPVESLLLVCSGTHEQAALEDTLAAGALCDLIWSEYSSSELADSAQMAREIYRQSAADLLGAMEHSRNGRRLLAMPELCADVPFCLQCDTLNLLATLGKDGAVRRV